MLYKIIIEKRTNLLIGIILISLIIKYDTTLNNYKYININFIKQYIHIYHL